MMNSEKVGEVTTDVGSFSVVSFVFILLYFFILIIVILYLVGS